MLDLNQKITSIYGVGETRARKLDKLGIKTVKDLLYFFPRTYKDLTRPQTIASLKVGEDAVIEAEIVTIAAGRTRRGFVVTNALVKDDSGQMPLVWFNQPYMARSLSQGEKYIFYGKVDASKATRAKQLNSPVAERYAKIIPIYPATAGLSSKQWRVILAGVVAPARDLPDYLPDIIALREKLMPLGHALRQVHEPSSMKLLEEARRRLAFDELLHLARQFMDFERDIHLRQAPAINIDESLLKKFVSRLPYKLTDGQRMAAWRIIKKMSAVGKTAQPLNCLLNGDVGSGKTVIALLASLGVIKAGYNAVWLAPTEILAQQHFDTVNKLAAGLKIKVNLVTASTLKSNFLNLKSIIIGTHALLYRKDTIGNIGLLVIDEQHRFGVGQRRELLREQARTGLIPHFLSLTATPIPRTLGMLISGAVTLITLKEKPKERKPIITKIISNTSTFCHSEHFDKLGVNSVEESLHPPVIPSKVSGVEESLHPPVIPSVVEESLSESDFSTLLGVEMTREGNIIDRNSAYQFIDAQIKRGRQVFVIVPLISASENSSGRLFGGERKALKTESERLKDGVFAHRKIGVLHGQMKKPDKDEAMSDFMAKKYDILVSTSVVEVGVDVPNASVMLIENAESFGLAQLHQFRGRVGRSKHQSYCFLAPSEAALSNSKTIERLNILAMSDDGFVIAQKDLELRGPGNLFGLEQSGFTELKLASLADTELIEKAKKVAEEIDILKYQISNDNIQSTSK